jgi:hypothetical protein
MNRTIFIVLVFICLLSYANKAMDELVDPGLIVKPQDAAITSIIKKIDEAKENGDIVLFKQLLKEYKELNPPVKIENGPQSIIEESKFKSKWSGNDIEVDSAYAYQEFSMDTRNDSRIYLAASRLLASGEDYRIPVWYSDDGISWTYYCNLFWNNHHLYNPSLKIVETPDTDYLFVAFEAYDRASPYDYDVLVYRRNLVSEDWIYYYVADNISIDEKDPSLDADDLQFPTGPYLHLAFESADSIAFIRSIDLGASWTSRTLIGSGNADWDYSDPSCAFGWYSSADSFTIGVAWSYHYLPDGDRHIRFRRNRSYGTSTGWLSTNYFLPPANKLDSRPSLKMTHGGSPSGVITFQRMDTVGTNDPDLYEYYTYDGGRAWTDDLLYVPGTQAILNCLSVDDNLGNYHSFFKGSNDDIRYKEAPYNDLDFSGWTESIQISDAGDISDVSSPASTVLDTMPCVCWKTFAPGWKLMFNALWFETGVEEDEFIPTAFHLTPNPSNGMANFSYSISKAGVVKISIYDISGRLIRDLIDETKDAGNYTLDINSRNLSSGIYFLHIITPDGRFTKSMTVVK